MVAADYVMEGLIDYVAREGLSDPALQSRFEREAAAALPVPASASPEDIFAALEWHRFRLRQDQQVQEWQGARA